MSVIVGIDEAGKGAVLGSLFIGSVAVSQGRTSFLQSLGLKDSKQLSSTERERLHQDISENFYSRVEIINPDMIDDTQRNLNTIEIDTIVDMMDHYANLYHTQDIHFYIDCFHTSESKFMDLLCYSLDMQFLNRMEDPEVQKRDGRIQITAEHKADDKYPVVSAASIVAKFLRDQSMRDLQKKYNEDVGSGYPADTITMNFIKKFYADHDKKYFPFETRTSWSTITKMHGQATDMFAE